MIDDNIILLMLKKVKPEYVRLCDENVKIPERLCCDNTGAYKRLLLTTVKESIIIYIIIHQSQFRRTKKWNLYTAKI